MACSPELIRNVAIVAHVDHGKTTIVDKMLSSCSVDLAEERLMDSIALERERGITIMSKCTRLEHNEHVLNVVDTPGHADFGGEVERVLGMVDGVLLVVDATEGPMSQTKFVLGKALERGLKPVVVINKYDRDSARTNGEVEDELFELFVNLGATDEQADYATLYASGKQGWATNDQDIAQKWRSTEPANPDFGALLDAIVECVPAPCDLTALNKPFALAVNNIGHDPYLGPLVTGKIESGTVGAGASCLRLERDTGAASDPSNLSDVLITRGTSKQPLNASAAGAGDIVTLAGVSGSVGDTITSAENGVSEPLDTPPLAPPTLGMTFGSNDGPLRGKDGDKLTGSVLKTRLHKETENNVTIRAERCETDAEKTDIFCRGELQLGILIEEMRREGFEFTVSPPRVLTTEDEQGNILEPVEEVTVDVENEYTGAIIHMLTSDRKGELLEMRELGEGRSRLVFEVPSRGLLGFQSEARAETHGSAVVNAVFVRHERRRADLGSLSPGKLVSMDTGRATAYALMSVQKRGRLFVEAGDEVYAGMVVGENSRAGDLEVNPCKTKKLTNIRSAGADEKLIISPAVRMSTEETIAYMGEDEVLEVTPKSLRLRKQSLRVRGSSARK